MRKFVKTLYVLVTLEDGKLVFAVVEQLPAGDWHRLGVSYNTKTFTLYQVFGKGIYKETVNIEEFENKLAALCGMKTPTL